LRDDRDRAAGAGDDPRDRRTERFSLDAQHPRDPFHDRLIRRRPPGLEIAHESNATLRLPRKLLIGDTALTHDAWELAEWRQARATVTASTAILHRCIVRHGARTKRQEKTARFVRQVGK